MVAAATELRESSTPRPRARADSSGLNSRADTHIHTQFQSTFMLHVHVCGESWLATKDL